MSNRPPGIPDASPIVISAGAQYHFTKGMAVGMTGGAVEGSTLEQVNKAFRRLAVAFRDPSELEARMTLVTGNRGTEMIREEFEGHRFMITPTDVGSASINANPCDLGNTKRRDFSRMEGVHTQDRPDGWYNQFNQRKVRK